MTEPAHPGPPMPRRPLAVEITVSGDSIDDVLSALEGVSRRLRTAAVVDLHGSDDAASWHVSVEHRADGLASPDYQEAARAWLQHQGVDLRA